MAEETNKTDTPVTEETDKPQGKEDTTARKDRSRYSDSEQKTEPKERYSDA